MFSEIGKKTFHKSKCNHIESSNMKIEAFSELILTNSIQNMLGGIIILNGTPSQEFCILMNVDEFL